MSVAGLIERYRTFNVDKTKISKWMKWKNDIVTVAADTQRKKNCSKLDRRVGGGGGGDESCEIQFVG